MSAKQEPAFPLFGLDVVVQPGMTLRDYFAAKAMQAFLTSPDFTDDQWMRGYAIDAYRMADAMLAERAKP